MTAPLEPYKILLKNKYYPDGLTSGLIYEYYINKKIKNLIINESNNRRLLFFYKFNFDQKYIIKRKYNNHYIFLNEKNYENIITGYNISISVETAYTSDKINEIVFDLDNKTNNINIKNFIKCITDIQNLFPDKKSRITNSANGFHLRLLLNKKISRRIILDSINLILNNSDLKNKYLINGKNLTPGKKEINIDLTAMQYRGSSTLPFALCRNGLVSRDITNFMNLEMFKFKESTINNFLKTL